MHQDTTLLELTAKHAHNNKQICLGSRIRSAQGMTQFVLCVPASTWMFKLMEKALQLCFTLDLFEMLYAAAGKTGISSKQAFSQLEANMLDGLHVKR